MLKNISENINESEERKKLGEKLEEEKKRFVINPAGAEVDQSKLSGVGWGKRWWKRGGRTERRKCRS